MFDRISSYKPLFFLLLLSLPSTAQMVLMPKWDKRFGGANRDELSVFQQTKDGGFVLGGSSTSPASGDKSQPNWDTTLQTYDYWVIKIDSFGNKQWDKRFGGLGDEFLTSILQTADSGYLLGGWSGSGADGDRTQPSWGGFDNWIVKIDNNGNKQWDRRYGGFNDDFLKAMVLTQDGGYFLSSFSYSPISGDKTQDDWDTTYNWSDYWVVKIDSLGNKQWDKRFGGIQEETLETVSAVNDGGYILGGNSASQTSDDKTQPNWDTTLLTPDYWVVKIDSLGNKQWDKRFGGIASDNQNAILQTNKGGYLLAGNSESGISGDRTENSRGGADYWLVKIDSLGNKEWDARYGGTEQDILYSIQPTLDGGYLLSGNSRSNAGGDKTENNLGLTQTWVVKTDSLGNKQWDKTMFTIESDAGYAFQTKGGCYVIANTSGGGIAGYKTQTNWSDSAANYWMIVFCDTLVSSVTPVTDTINFTVYPNPFVRDIAIVLQKQGLQTATFTITNLQGQTVYHQQENNLASSYTKMLDLSYLSSGVYFVEVDVDGDKVTREVVKSDP